MKFSINYIRFEDEYKDSIIDGINNAFSKLYTSNINIRYTKINNNYEFVIYYSLPYISKDNKILYKQVVIHSYDNIEAINLFSNIPIKEYEKKYDEGKKLCLRKFKKFLQGIQVMLSLTNHECKYNIQYKNVNHINYILYYEDEYTVNRSYNRRLSKSFNFSDIITQEEYDKETDRINKALKKYNLF